MLLLPMLLVLGCERETQPAPILRRLWLPDLFTDHMVLQQQRDNSIWGKCSSGAEVVVKASWGSKVETIADDDGRWQVELPTPGAGGPFTVSVSVPGDLWYVRDVMVGEVWLAAGQSNMQMPLMGWPPHDTLLNSAREISLAQYPEIRFFGVKEGNGPVPLDTLRGYWEPVKPEKVEYYSAAAYFFARELHQELGVPVGILQATVGGTDIETWMSKDALASFPNRLGELDAHTQPDWQQVHDQWMQRWPLQPLPEDWNLFPADTGVISLTWDRSHWQRVAMPGPYDHELQPGSMDGAIWLCHTFWLDSVPDSATLVIGAVDDMDRAYVNGVAVGATLGREKHRERRAYPLPKGSLRQGRNVAALQVMDLVGIGSVQGPLLVKEGNVEVVNLAGEWEAQWAADFFGDSFRSYDPRVDLGERRCLVRPSHSLMTACNNEMIHPLRDYGIKGVIWYQGEGNVWEPEAYDDLMEALILDYRRQWGEEMPFYFVQPAPYNYGERMSSQHLPLLWESQRAVLGRCPQTGMASTIDNEVTETVHPPDKQSVGMRLAALALSRAYGRGGVGSGPLILEAKARGSQVVLRFEEVGKGLEIRGECLDGFEVAAEDGLYLPADAQIVGQEVVLTLPCQMQPRWVRYAFYDMPVASLWNRDGFPAFPFQEEVK